MTYQAIIAKGELRALRKALLLQGRILFGEPPEEVSAAVESIRGIDQLNQLLVRLLHVQNWQELLDLPRPPAPKRRRSPRDKR